jgi:hypothetical protein
VTTKSVALFLAALVATVLIAVVASQFASSEPDGLEYVAEREGFADQAEEHALTDEPLAGYGENLKADGGLSTGIAGLVGVVAAMGLGFALFWVIRSPKDRPPRSSP